MPVPSPQLSAALSLVARAAVVLVTLALVVLVVLGVPRLKSFARATYLAGFIAGLTAAGVGRLGEGPRSTPPGAA